MALNGDKQKVIRLRVFELLSELGASAAAGRLIDAAREDADGSGPVAVLSFRLWQRRFGSDPSIVGRSIYLDGKAAR